jgi:hypothetical protein
MSDEEDIAALVVDNGSGMCKGKNTEQRKEKWTRTRHKERSSMAVLATNS